MQKLKFKKFRDGLICLRKVVLDRVILEVKNRNLAAGSQNMDPCGKASETPKRTENIKVNAKIIPAMKMPTLFSISTNVLYFIANNFVTIFLCLSPILMYRFMAVILPYYLQIAKIP